MKINSSTGEIALECGFALSPEVSRAQFLASPAGMRSAIFVENEPWCSFRLAKTDNDVVVVVYFKGELLESVQVCSVDPKFGIGWDERNHAKEMQRKAVNDRWLFASGVTPGKKYAWGSVWSGFDRNGGFSSAVVRYWAES